MRAQAFRSRCWFTRSPTATPGMNARGSFLPDLQLRTAQGLQRAHCLCDLGYSEPNNGTCDECTRLFLFAFPCLGRSSSLDRALTFLPRLKLLFFCMWRGYGPHLNPLALQFLCMPSCTWFSSTLYPFLGRRNSSSKSINPVFQQSASPFPPSAVSTLNSAYRPFMSECANPRPLPLVCPFHLHPPSELSPEKLSKTTYSRTPPHVSPHQSSLSAHVFRLLMQFASYMCSFSLDIEVEELVAGQFG